VDLILRSFSGILAVCGVHEGGAANQLQSQEVAGEVVAEVDGTAANQPQGQEVAGEVAAEVDGSDASQPQGQEVVVDFVGSDVNNQEFGMVNVDYLFDEAGENLVMAVPLSIISDPQLVNEYIINALSSAVQSSVTDEQTKLPDDLLNIALSLDESNLTSSFVIVSPNPDGSSTREPRRGRKRVRDEKTWKRNILKTKRNCGEEYVNSKGTTIPKKSVQKFDCGGCSIKIHQIAFSRNH